MGSIYLRTPGVNLFDCRRRLELSGFEADCSSRTDREGGDYAGSRATSHPRRQDGRHGDIRRSAVHGGRDTISSSRTLPDQILLEFHRGS